MKRWFCGFASATDLTLAALPQPLDGKTIWEGTNPFWVCGSWGKQQIITMNEGFVRLAIVGTCLAPYETLVELFQSAIRKNDYSQLIRLPGNYNLIVQDKSDTYIFVDVAGLKPVFYTAYNSFIAYSSLGVTLQQLIEAEVDRCWLANSLAGMTMLNLFQNRSPFSNVQVIPPGHYLQISEGKPTCKRYWNGPQEYNSFSQAAEKLRSELLTAVEGRVGLYGNVTSDLSGGFDSTTLALIAAKSLATQGQKLQTITLKGVSSTESEDVKWATHAASLYPNIESVMIEADEIPAEFSNLESIPLTDAPEPCTLGIGKIGYVMKIAKSQGSQLHLNGEGGDAVLEAPSSYLADLLRRAKIRTFFLHTYGSARSELSSPVALLKDAIKLNFTSYRQWLLQQSRMLISRHKLSNSLINQQSMRETLGWDSGPNVANWYTKNSVDSVVAEIERWATVATPSANSPGENEYIASIQALGCSCVVHQQLAETYDVNLEFPFFDSLVIDACLSAKPEERTTPFAYKPLLPKALERDLPQSIFTRSTKGDYTSDEFFALRQNLPVIKEFFETSLLADMGLIEIGEFRTYMKQLSLGLVAGSFPFHQTLATELWLRRVVDAKNSFWMEIKH